MSTFTRTTPLWPLHRLIVYTALPDYPQAMMKVKEQEIQLQHLQEVCRYD